MVHLRDPIEKFFRGVPGVMSMATPPGVALSQTAVDKGITPSPGLEGHAVGVALAANPPPSLFHGQLAVFVTLL